MVPAYRPKIPGWTLNIGRLLAKMVISKVVTCSPGVEKKYKNKSLGLPTCRLQNYYPQKSDVFFIGRTTLGENVSASKLTIKP